MNDNIVMHPRAKTATNSNFLNYLLCILCITCFASAPAYALTRVFVTNYQRLDIKIARNELTHIVVKHDRIQQVRGLKGRYFLDKDDQTGSIYLLPSPTYQKKSFSIFIITETGKTYTLRCMPTDQPADTILLTKHVATMPARSQTHAPANHNRRVHTMKHRYVYTRHAKRKVNERTRLLKAMMKHQFIKGYYYRHSFIVRHQYLADKTLKVWIPLEYLPRHGRKYQGQFLIVKNNTQHNVVLTPDLFQTDQTSNQIEVIEIKEPLLKPHTQTRVYRILRIKTHATDLDHHA